MHGVALNEGTAGLGARGGALRVTSRELVDDDFSLARGECRPTTFPVRVALDGSRELQGYRGLAVTGRCGAIDDSLSAEILLPPPVPGGRAGRALRGLCFPPASWDGSDVFTAEDYAGAFVVNRVKEALEAARVTNVEFSRLSTLERTWRADGSPL